VKLNRNRTLRVTAVCVIAVAWTDEAGGAALVGGDKFCFSVAVDLSVLAELAGWFAIVVAAALELATLLATSLCAACDIGGANGDVVDETLGVSTGASTGSWSAGFVPVFSSQATKPTSTSALAAINIVHFADRFSVRRDLLSGLIGIDGSLSRCIIGTGS
jgi:hypothetical protein